MSAAKLSVLREGEFLHDCVGECLLGIVYESVSSHTPRQSRAVHSLVESNYGTVSRRQVVRALRVLVSRGYVVRVGRVRDAFNGGYVRNRSKVMKLEMEMANA